MTYPKKVFIPLGIASDKVAVNESEKTQLEQLPGFGGWAIADQLEGDIFIAQHHEGTAENPSQWTVYSFFSLSNSPHLRVIHSSSSRIPTEKLETDPRAWHPHFEEYKKWRPDSTIKPYLRPYDPNPLRLHRVGV
jgi:hypothetical protein